MPTQNLTFTEFADLLITEAERGIISKEGMQRLLEENKLPKIIRDIRGAIRLMVERTGDCLAVTEYATALSNEKIGEIYK
jgi:hypothetical protein